jgi:phosphoribosylglycinamide formyltransferase-1
MLPLKLAFFVSHEGTTMQAVIEACKSGQLKAKPCVVISNNSNSMALTRAQYENIPYRHISKATYPTFEQMDESILDILRGYNVNLILLLGYLKKLGPKTISSYNGRILNLHPALLPKYGGKGMFGTNVHKAVLDAGEKYTGVTIHIVDDEYDHGAIVAQCTVPIEPGDNPESLAIRVKAIEHKFIVDIIQNIEQGKISLNG